MRNDLVSEQLRAAEREIDAHHLTNPLFQQPFSIAAWWFLAACEEHGVREIIRRDAANSQELSAIADNVVRHAKWPLRWLTQACAQGGAVPREYNANLYSAAWQLSEHSMDYLAFESAFCYATYGLLTLSLEGNLIKASGPMRGDSRFEASPPPKLHRPCCT